MNIKLQNNKILICFFILFYILRNNREKFENKNNKIFLKIFRDWHPWNKGLKRNSENKIIFENESKNKNKKTITSILVLKTLYNLENKIELSKFLQNKSYYPKTYIYNKYSRYIPNNNDTWFVKNCSINTYGGKGVSVVNNYDDLKKSLNLDNDFIIQKSISDIYLTNNTKGDFRVHYLVIFYKDQLSFYLYKKGHIKLAKNKYDINSINNEIQITSIPNTEVNSSRYIEFSEKYVDYNILYPKIKELFIDFSTEIKNSFPKNYKSFYALEYQICGPDIIFDNNLNPYLFELNSNFPSYYTNKHSFEVKEMKENMAYAITKHLFDPAIKNEEIELENYGFVKLL